MKQRQAKEWIKEMKPCPDCGRMPHIRVDSIHSVTVECRPWYSRRAHLRVRIGYCQPSQLMTAAVEKWNAATVSACLPVW